MQLTLTLRPRFFAESMPSFNKGLTGSCEDGLQRRSWFGVANKRIHILLPGQIPAKLFQCSRFAGTQNGYHEAIKFVFKIGVRHRIFHAANRVLHEHMRLAAILAGDGRIDRSFVDAFVDGRHNFAAQFKHVRAIDDGIIVLVFTRLPENQTGCG